MNVSGFPTQRGREGTPLWVWKTRFGGRPLFPPGRRNPPQPLTEDGSGSLASSPSTTDTESREHQLRRRCRQPHRRMPAWVASRPVGSPTQSANAVTTVFVLYQWSRSTAAVCRTGSEITTVSRNGMYGRPRSQLIGAHPRYWLAVSTTCWLVAPTIQHPTCLIQPQRSKHMATQLPVCWQGLSSTPILVQSAKRVGPKTVSHGEPTLCRSHESRCTHCQHFCHALASQQHP
jgi:hypothetical protein